MELLTTNVMDATGLDPTIAKAAIGQVLLFLRSEAPLGHVAEFIDKCRGLTKPSKRRPRMATAASPPRSRE